MPPGPATGQPAVASRRRPARCRSGGPCAWRTRRRRPLARSVVPVRAAPRSVAAPCCGLRSPRTHQPSWRPLDQRGRDRPTPASNVDARSTGRTAESTPAPAQRTSAANTKRTGGPADTAPPAALRWAHPPETASRSYEPDSTNSGSPDRPNRTPYCGPRPAPSRFPRPPPPPPRPRSTGTATPPAGGPLRPRPRTVSYSRSPRIIFGRLPRGRCGHKPSPSVPASRNSSQSPR